MVVVGKVTLGEPVQHVFGYGCGGVKVTFLRGGGASASSSWGSASGGACAVGLVSGNLLPVRTKKPSGVSWRTMSHLAVCSGDHWWGPLCGRWRVTWRSHLQLW